MVSCEVRERESEDKEVPLAWSAERYDSCSCSSVSDEAFALLPNLPLFSRTCAALTCRLSFFICLVPIFPSPFSLVVSHTTQAA